MGRPPDPGRQGLRRRPLGRRDPRVPRHAHRARPEQPVARPVGGREPRPVRADAGRRVPERGAGAARQDRHGLAEHQPAGSRSCTGSSTPRTRAPATPGASTRPTTSRTASPTRSRASPTRSARSSSRPTGPCTTGSSRTCRCRLAPRQYEFARLNLTYTVLSKRVLLRPRRRGARPRLGRPADAHDLGPAPARVPRPRGSATSRR